jgi:predicted nucleic acid-binding protein
MERDFPEQYSSDLLKILKGVSIGTPTVVGSSADPKIMYSADYDLMEDPVLRNDSAKTFQKKIKQIQKIGNIVDIKIGEISDWNLLTKPYIQNGHVKDYDQTKELEHLASLWSSKIITSSEYKTAKKLLKSHLNSVEFLKARKELRFGILRWDLKEISKGYKELRDKSIIYLYDAFKTKGITKIDIVTWLKNKYVEISNIIIWTNSSGKPYAHIPSIKQSLAENILEFEAEGNYVKVAKRMLSLAKQFKNHTDREKLTEILNSPLGKLYLVSADIEVLKEFPSAVSKYKRKELDLLKDEFAKLFFPELNKAVPNLKLLPKMKEVLQREMKKALELKHLLPITRDYQI